MTRRPPQLLLWDAPSWFPRAWEGSAWFVFGSIATCLVCVVACFATDAFDRDLATIEFERHTCDGGVRQLVVIKPESAAARELAPAGEPSTPITTASKRALTTRRSRAHVRAERR